MRSMEHSIVHKETYMRVIAFYSQKGGAGKTTASVNVGVALAQKRRRTLVLDLDSKACASEMLGVQARRRERTVGAASVRHCTISAVAIPVGDGLCMAPGGD